MYAVVITRPGGPEVLSIQEVQDPVIGPDEVLVEIKATALNRGDARRREAGSFEPPVGTRDDILGLEMAGVVSAVGERVADPSPGDHVFALLAGGGYAQRVAVHHRMAIPIPANLSFTQAAAIPEVFFTAFDALFNRCHLMVGERVLIHAVGSGVGSAAIQLAHTAGGFTLGTAGSAEKLSKAADLRLDVGINYREQDFAQVVLAETQGQGVDLIFDLVGPSYWERNLASLATSGRMALVSSLGGREVPVDLGSLTPKRASVYGTVLRTRTLQEKILLTEQFRRNFLPLFASGLLCPVIDREFSLSDVVEAHRYLETNANFGKVVFTVDKALSPG